MLKRNGWQALQEAREGAMPRQLEFSFAQQSPERCKNYDQCTRPENPFILPSRKKQAVGNGES
jgi:hypothetical protein